MILLCVLGVALLLAAVAIRVMTLMITGAIRASKRETLDRYYVFELFGFALFVHRIHHSDPPRVMHTHPWSWFSIIFGRYTEERPGWGKRTCWFWNAMRAGKAHRVTLTHGPVWTILIHGRRRCQWAVTDDHGAELEVEPWRGVDNPDRTSYAP